MPRLEEKLPKFHSLFNKYVCGVFLLRKSGVRESLCRLFVAERLACTHAFPTRYESSKPKLENITDNKIMKIHHELLLKSNLYYTDKHHGMDEVIELKPRGIRE